MNILPVETE